MKYQKGFSAVEGLLILVVVGILGFTGWFVWRSKQNVDNVSMQTITNSQPATFDKKYTDTAKVYRLTYPSSWRLSHVDPGSGEGKPIPDWTKVSRDIRIMPSGLPMGALFDRAVEVNVAPADAVWVTEHMKAADKFHTVKKMKINGYDAYLDHLDYIGPSAAEKYTDDYWVFIHEGKALTLSFREKYYHNTVTPGVIWDDSKYLPAVKEIINSIRFE